MFLRGRRRGVFARDLGSEIAGITSVFEGKNEVFQLLFRNFANQIIGFVVFHSKPRPGGTPCCERRDCTARESGDSAPVGWRCPL